MDEQRHFAVKINSLLNWKKFAPFHQTRRGLSTNCLKTQPRKHP